MPSVQVSRRPCRARGRLLLSLLSIITGLATVAAAPPPVAPPDPQAVTVEQVQSRLAELEALAPPIDGQAAAIEELNQALSFLQETADHVAAVADLEARARSAPERLSALRSELAVPPTEVALDAPPEAKAEDLTPQLEAARVQLTTAQRIKAETSAETARRRERRMQIPDLMAAATQRRDELRDALAAGPDADTPPVLAEARHWRRTAELAAVEARLRRLPTEVASYDARRDVLDARGEVADRRVADALRLAEAWDKLISERRVLVAQRATADAVAARLEAADQHELVRLIRQENEDFARELAETTARNQAAVDARLTAESDLAQLRTRVEQSQLLVDRIGLTEAVGIVLHRHRSELPGVHSWQSSLHESESELRRVQLREIELGDLERSLEDIQAAAQRRLAAVDTPRRANERAALLKAVSEALTAQRELVDSLHDAYSTYFEEGLSGKYRLQQELLDETESYKRFIDERILWIKSTDALKPGDIRPVGSGILWLLSPENWSQLLLVYWGDLVHRPMPIGLGFLVAVMLIVVRSRLREVAHRLSKQVGRVTTDQLSVTPRGVALQRVAQLMLVAGLVQEACRAEGLAEVHFRWKPANLKKIRRHLRWLMTALVPLTIIVIAARGEQQVANSLGRVAFLAATVLLAVFLYRVLHPRQGILQGVISQNRGGWLDRLQGVWFWTLVMIPLALALVSAAGYSYTAEQLIRRCLDSIVLGLIVMVAYAVLLRCLMVAQRRLAYEQARQRLAQARAEAEAEAASQDATGPDAPAEADDLELDVQTMSTQTRKLLRSLVGFSLVVGLFFVWVDVLPALGMLRRIDLWSQLVSVTSAATGADGATEMVQASVSITLADLLLALVILAVTVAITRNIPGLLEIMILQRLPFSPSARYAITTIARYALVILGVVLAFNAIGIGWSKVQWLAAAAAVGLGFGLQEIVANFVSGLIILFERPVRVGDTVTVGSVTGTVSRIRIRATTIIDWDRKELIIPNKEFVTGQIINWSLSDSIIRVKIPVGIAYGSDTALAKKLLLKCAKSCPHTLDEPPPTAMFLGFGDSSLDFELRVFIPNMDVFNESRDALHLAIDNAFRKAGVEIAFPQRDLHLRSVRAELPVRDVQTPAPEPYAE
jgi:potassium efflux system protein